jgi:uncharacterized integral membrane protein
VIHKSAYVHLVFLAFAAMRWLIIALLVSLGGLLLAVAGMARHILLQRAKLRRKSLASVSTNTGTPEENDLESEV